MHGSSHFINNIHHLASSTPYLQQLTRLELKGAKAEPALLIAVGDNLKVRFQLARGNQIEKEMLQRVLSVREEDKSLVLHYPKQQTACTVRRAHNLAR